MIILHIHKGYFHGHNTLPLLGETCSAIDEQTETGSGAAKINFPVKSILASR